MQCGEDRGTRRAALLITRCSLTLHKTSLAKACVRSQLAVRAAGELGKWCVELARGKTLARVFLKFL